jgi:hypothetical protein
MIMQKKLLLLFFATNIFLSGSSQSQSYFQQQVNYVIDVSLKDADSTLQVCSDYFKSALVDDRFWKTISFSINLDVFKLIT